MSALTLPASSRKRCSHGSCAKPLPSTAFKCRFGTPILPLIGGGGTTLSAAGPPERGRAPARCASPEPQALEAVALVRRVEGVVGQREAAHDRRDARSPRAAASSGACRPCARTPARRRRRAPSRRAASRSAGSRVEERRLGQLERDRDLGAPGGAPRAASARARRAISLGLWPGASRMLSGGRAPRRERSCAARRPRSCSRRRTPARRCARRTRRRRPAPPRRRRRRRSPRRPAAAAATTRAPRRRAARRRRRSSSRTAVGVRAATARSIAISTCAAFSTAPP